MYVRQYIISPSGTFVLTYCVM